MPTILTPIDFSKVTAAVIAEASTLVRALKAQLVLLNVTPPPFIASDDPRAAEIIVKLNTLAQKAADKKLALWQTKLEAAGIPTKTMHRLGSPAMAIAEAARELRADYVIMGSHGHGAFYDLLVGSTTSGLLKRSPCPVVVVAQQPKKRKR